MSIEEPLSLQQGLCTATLDLSWKGWAQVGSKPAWSSPCHTCCQYIQHMSEECVAEVFTEVQGLVHQGTYGIYVDIRKEHVLAGKTPTPGVALAGAREPDSARIGRPRARQPVSPRSKPREPRRKRASKDLHPPPISTRGSCSTPCQVCILTAINSALLPQLFTHRHSAGFKKSGCDHVSCALSLV